MPPSEAKAHVNPTRGIAGLLTLLIVGAVAWAYVTGSHATGTPTGGGAGPIYTLNPGTPTGGGAGPIYTLNPGTPTGGGAGPIYTLNPGPIGHPSKIVLYQLTGSARSADLTYTDSSGNTQQQTGVAVPLRTASGSSGILILADSGTFVQFSAQNNGDSGDLTCTILANGVQINTGHASGGYAIVSCSAEVP
jgi:hypothetical protein